MSRRPVARAAALLVLCALSGCALGGMYGDRVEVLTAANFQKSVVDSSSLYLVKFFAPWCGHCRSSAPAVSKAASKLDGVAKVGVVDCDEEKALCSKYGVQGFPTIKVFKGEGKKARRPSDYSGQRTATALVDHAKYVMPSFVARVKESGLDAFFSDESKIPHVMLFTDKSSTSPLFKGLSAEFRKRLAFGEVRKADAAGAMTEKFGVDSYPKLVAFKAGDMDPAAAVVHTGAMDPKSLRKFLSSIAAGTVPEQDTSGDKEGDAAEAKPKVVFSQPKAFAAEAVPIVSGSDYVANCGVRKDGRMCGLAFVPGGTGHPLTAALGTIAVKFQYDNLAFSYIDSGNADGGGAAFAAAFGVDASKGGFVVVRARKVKFATLDPGAQLSAAAVTDLVDRVLSGDARFKKLSGDLPEWAGPESTGSSEGAQDSEGGSVEQKAGEDSGQCGTEPPKDGGSCGTEPKIDL
jgi:protein disulfide-isomerase-like protein